MSYKDKKWDDFEVSYLKTFGKDVPVFTPSVYREHRGEMFTTFHSKSHPVNNFVENGMDIHAKFSFSRQNVLRGLHYDFSTWKLAQATVGEIFFVVLDMRPDSNSYGKSEAFILSDKTRDQVLVPPGFANGHFAITECLFYYYLFYDGSYINEDQQGTISFNDAEFGIKWPTTSPILQERDTKTRKFTI